MPGNSPDECEIAMVQERYVVNPDVAYHGEMNGAVLYSPDTEAIRGINAVGRLIWQALARPRTSEEIIAILAAACEDASIDQVSVDVELFLQSLQSWGFIGTVLAQSADCSPRGRGSSRQQRTPLGYAPPNEDRLYFYRGMSMAGTFHPGDCLTIEPASITAVHPGDVVLFGGQDQAEGDDDIVHRVVAVEPGGLVTRGDSLLEIDHALVTQDRLLGRVTHLERGGRRYPVWGGRRGLLYARVLCTWRWACRVNWRLPTSPGRRAYRWLRRSGLVHRFWRPDVTRVVVASNKGPLVKYVISRRTVAWWLPGNGRFRCRKPYDLIIPRPR